MSKRKERPDSEDEPEKEPQRLKYNCTVLIKYYYIEKKTDSRIQTIKFIIKIRIGSEFITIKP